MPKFEQTSLRYPLLTTPPGTDLDNRYCV